jgi:Tfp pilus assembly protein PilP
MARLILLLAVLVLAPLGTASAQETPPPDPAAAAGLTPAAGEAPPGPTDEVIREILRPGQYTYQPEGRRDPFVSLLANVAPAGSDRPRPPGLAGFLVSEVTLKGIVKTQGEFVCMLAATDGASYFARVGQEMFDGALIAMDEATATFRQEVQDPLSPVRTREVVKSLYPSEEAR